MLLQILIIGALMGILGQGARAVVGLKGMSDDAKAQGLSPNDLFEAARLLTSFLIGSLVGLASALIYLKGFDKIADIQWPEVTTMLAWAVSAYAGTDFLEGFISQYLSKGASTPTVKLHTASIDALTTQLVKKLPTYPKGQASTWVKAAFAALTPPISNVQCSDTLGKPPISGSSADFSYLKLFGKNNDQIKANNANNVLVGLNAMQSWSDSTKVSDLITMVQYAPSGSAT
jgi:hypothetical protein